MRKIHLYSFILSILSTLFISCEKIDAPHAEFLVNQTDSAGYVIVKFTDNSTNNATNWKWTFEGGTPYSSKKQNPTVIYTQTGIFDVTLVAKNDGGRNEIIKSDFVTIVQITNKLHTEAKVIMDDQIKYLPSKIFIRRALFDNSKSDCYIETSGKNQYDEQIGLLISWDFEINPEKYQIYNFGLTSDVAYFNLTNNSDYSFTHFHVNCNNYDYESMEEIVIPNDGNKHGIGYYYANTGMEVRTYFPEGYIYWIEDYSFYIPWTNNQSVDLEYGKSGKTVYKNITDISLITPDVSNLNISTKNGSIKSNDGENVRFITQSKINNQDL